MSDNERLAAIEQRLTSITASLTRIEVRLFGLDGDAGVIGKHDKRISILENWRWWLVGLAIGLGVVGGGVFHKLLGMVGQ